MTAAARRRLAAAAALLAVASTAAAEPTTAAIRTACERGAPGCDPAALLSPLERRAVDRALAARGLVLDRAPHGKRLGAIHVVTLDVFGPGDGFLRWLDVFHVTTTEATVRAELTFAPGEPWDHARVAESARRLRDPLSTTLAAIVPVRAAAPGAVDALVVTRDVWSLRTNSSYEFQDRALTYLALSLSENNLLGRRTLLALAFRMDQGESFVGPVFIDRNLLGRHLELRGRAGPLYARQGGELEGSESTLAFGRPLWSLDTRWAAGLEWSHRHAVDRTFRGAALATYDAPETAEVEAAPYAYRMRRASLTGRVTRAWGTRYEQRLGGGWQVASTRPSLLDDFAGGAALRDAFVRDVLPRSERVSLGFVGWELFEPRYRNLQNVQTFELAEDTRLGAELEATVGVSLAALGSDATFVRLSAGAAYAGALGHDGAWRVALRGSTRLEDGRAVDDVVDARVRLVSPSAAAGRLVSELRGAAVLRDTQNLRYRLGGDTGLRGFAINEFEGVRRVVWNTELRSRPVPLLFTRWGGVLFYDVGGAGDRVEQVRLHHDAGVGVRVLTPQLAPEVFRFDFAFALDRDALGRFRFSAGYEQAF